MNNNMEYAKLTVRMAMTLPELRNLKLITGESGLDKVIEHVTAFEIGAIPFFSGGEFVLSGGRTFSHNFTLQVATVKQLAEKGVVALAIKKTEEFKTIPDVIVKECKKLGLPLFEIESFAKYRPIMHAIMKKIFDIKTIAWVSEMNHLLRFEDDADIERLSSWVETKSFQPCIIIDANDKMYGGNKGKDYLSDISKKTAHLRAARKCKGSLEFNFEHNGEFYRATVFWIHTEQGDICLILVAEQTDTSTDTSLGYMGASLLAHLLEEREALYQSEAVKLLQYFQVIKDPLEVICFEAQRHFGLNLKQPVRMFIANCSEAQCDEIYHYWREIHNQCVIYKLTENSIIGILPDTINPSVLVSSLPDNLGAIWFGAGRAYDNPMKLSESYQEACIALKAISNYSTGGIVEYGELGVLHLLSELKNSDIMQRFRETYIDPITRYDAMHQTYLMKTLQVYFSCNRKIKCTAERLVIGKTTLIYRLKKIESLTGVSLACGGDGLSLQIAALSEELFGAGSKY